MGEVAATNEPDSSVRLRLFLILALVTPLGIATKFYTGPAEMWVRTRAGGLLYVVFWCLLALVLRPNLSPWIVAAAVLFITSILEFLQLWHPAPLQAIRSTWLGHALIGSSFSWSDFPYYGAGAVLTILIVQIYRGSRQLSGGAAT
jgi:hypothetical protein